MESAELAPPTVVAGWLPPPIVTSRQDGWHGLIVERYRADALDVELHSPAVLVTVHTGPPTQIAQTRNHRVEFRRMNQGDITVTPAGATKGWQARERIDLLAVWIDPLLIGEIGARLDGEHSERTELVDYFGGPDSQVEHIGLSLLLELEQRECGATLYVESLATQLVVHLLRRYSVAGTAAPPAASTLPASKLRKVTAYINENLSGDITLVRIAQVAGISPYHFARLFKRTTGLAPHQYLIARRMAVAKSLLRDTDLPIAEVAQRVGCSNQSHFSTLFQRAAAMTPGAFRRQRC